MSHFKRIILDLDGPLLDGKEKHYHCYRSILGKYGFKAIGINEYWERKRALVNRRELLHMSGAGGIYDDYLVAWEAMIESSEALALDKVQQGAVDCLYSWKERGAELALVTMRKNKKTLEEQLNSTGLRRHMDAILVSDYAEGGEGKADVVRNMFTAAQFEENVLWIGDTEADWKAAKTLGCGVVLVSNGLRNESYLKSLHGALVMPSIASLRDIMTGEWGN